MAHQGMTCVDMKWVCVRATRLFRANPVEGRVLHGAAVLAGGYLSDLTSFVSFIYGDKFANRRSNTAVICDLMNSTGNQCFDGWASCILTLTF